jgi:hypothetical protein
MTIASPSSGVLHFNKIPVECSHCDYSNVRSEFSDETKQAIIQATIYFDMGKERKMLRRIRLLFDRHPNSRHRKILAFTSNSKKLTATPDPEFESDLLDNPEIKEYLKSHYFDLVLVKIMWKHVF